MVHTPRPIDSKLIQELVSTGHEAVDAMCDSVSLDLAVGNDGCDDVESLREALDRLEAALDKMKQAGFS